MTEPTPPDEELFSPAEWAELRATSALFDAFESTVAPFFKTLESLLPPARTAPLMEDLDD